MRKEDGSGESSQECLVSPGPMSPSLSFRSSSTRKKGSHPLSDVAHHYSNKHGARLLSGPLGLALSFSC